MVCLCKVPWSFWWCWTMMDVWWTSLMEMFMASVFGPELPRRRLLGAPRFRCFSLERSILGAFRPWVGKVEGTHRSENGQKLWKEYQDEDCRDAQEHGTFFLLEIEDRRHADTHTVRERTEIHQSLDVRSKPIIIKAQHRNVTRGFCKTTACFRVALNLRNMLA